MNDTGQGVKRVVIAGGGTAGWVAAAALVKHLAPLIDITLIESDEIGTVGVGESTIPTIRSFHNFLGINEDAFVRATRASFKLGISFEHWDRIDDRYFHAFGSAGRSVPAADFQHFWLEARRQGFAGEFGDYSLEQQAAAQNKFGIDEQVALAYAYHIDATAYAKFLRGLAEPAGVRRIEGRIEQVEQHGESGDITALVLASGERIEGDLFIDCTGFRALLIEQTLDAGFDDWSEWLATDSAFVVQTKSVAPPIPYTRVIAHEGGWRWRIPLQNRVGNGIVFASEYMSNDDARDRLLAEIEGEPLSDPRLIRYRTGARRRMWHRNCVSLGLASGFIEPLESTSIHLIMIAVMRLIQSFPFDGVTESAAARFNEQSRQEWEHVRDFIILHYKLNSRDEAFWRSRAAMPIPESLAHRIALFRESAAAYQAQDELFRIDSWVEVMLGQGVEPAGYHHLARLMPAADLKRAFGDLEATIRQQLSGVPPLEAFLARYQ